jgi:hypothetical protein
VVADREGAVDGRADAPVVRVVDLEGDGQQPGDMPAEERLQEAVLGETNRLSPGVAAALQRR